MIQESDASEWWQCEECGLQWLNIHRTKSEGCPHMIVSEDHPFVIEPE